MFNRFKKKSKRYVAFDVNEFLIRAIVMNTSDIKQATLYECPLNTGIFEEGILVDEMALYEEMKSLVQKWGIKRYDVRFFVPDNSVMMKSFEHPSEISTEKLKSYVEMEIGRTIHLPFTQPLIDVYDYLPNDGEATLFAAPSEEINKLAGLLDDLSLHPTIADVRPLSSIRFFEKTIGLAKGKSYLISEWDLDGVSISIYKDGKVEFLRHQSIDISKGKWTFILDNNQHQFTYNGNIEEYRGQLLDQIAELDRILNFYRFSLYKGERAVDEIIVFGCSPEMDYIVSEMRSSFNTPIQCINDEKVQAFHANFSSKDIPLIGLIYREEQ